MDFLFRMWCQQNNSLGNFVFINSLKLTAKAPENGLLEYFPFGPIFGCDDMSVSRRVITKKLVVFGHFLGDIGNSQPARLKSHKGSRRVTPGRYDHRIHAGWYTYSTVASFFVGRCLRIIYQSDGSYGWPHRLKKKHTNLDRKEDRVSHGP